MEKYIGRDAVIAMIDDAASAPLTLTVYPRNGDFVVVLIAEMQTKIASFEAKQDENDGEIGLFRHFLNNI